MGSVIVTGCEDLSEVLHMEEKYPRGKRILHCDSDRLSTVVSEVLILHLLLLLVGGSNCSFPGVFQVVFFFVLFVWFFFKKR